MSRQTGLIRLDGKIGGISFYRAGGNDFARTATGPSKQKIDSDPAFIRTRENNAEFGGSANAAKSMRIALANVIQTMADSRITSRLTKIFKEINTKGTGARGQRSIAVSSNRIMLTNLELNKELSFSSIFNAPFVASNNAGRTTGTITIAAFLPSSFIAAPSGATHFRIITAIGVVSDFNYNATTQSYEPTDSALSTLSGVNFGAVTDLASTTPVNFTLAAALGGTLTMTATVSVVQCLGIEFFQRVGTVDYLLAQGNAMKIVKVF